MTPPTLASITEIRSRKRMDAVPVQPVDRDEVTVAAIATDLYELLVSELASTPPGRTHHAAGLATALAAVTGDPAERLLELARNEAQARVSGVSR